MKFKLEWLTEDDDEENFDGRVESVLELYSKQYDIVSMSHSFTIVSGRTSVCILMKGK